MTSVASVIIAWLLSSLTDSGTSSVLKKDVIEGRFIFVAYCCSFFGRPRARRNSFDVVAKWSVPEPTGVSIMSAIGVGLSVLAASFLCFTNFARLAFWTRFLDSCCRLRMAGVGNLVDTIFSVGTKRSGLFLLL